MLVSDTFVCSPQVVFNGTNLEAGREFVHDKLVLQVRHSACQDECS